MRKVCFLIGFFCSACFLSAGGRPAFIDFTLHVTHWKPDSANVIVTVVFFNRSDVPLDLSTAGKINLTCRIRGRTMRIPGQQIEVIRSLQPRIAALKLLPHRQTSQQIQFRAQLRPGEIAEINGDVEIGDRVYKTNTLSLKKE